MAKKSIFFFFVFVVFFSFGIKAQNNEGAFSYAKNLEIYANVLKALNISYIDSLDFSDLNKTAIDALLSKLDPYTVYIPQADKDNYEFVRTGEYGGVGLGIVKNPHEYAYVSNLLSHQTAEKAGLQIGDKILRIDGRDTREMDMHEMGTIIKGSPGQPFILSVERIGDSTSTDYLLTRENIKVQNIAFSTILYPTIAYIDLQSFTLNAAEDLLYTFLELKKHNPQGLIIDLRANGGGLILEAVRALNVFLQSDLEVVRTEGRQANSEYIYRTQRPPVDLAIPIVILVGDQTASAAEIMAGAAQDYDRAVLMGQNTYGKGVVQNVIPLNYDAQLKITIARYLLPSGRKIQKEKPKDSLRVFKTLNGRAVHEGNGLTPDLIIREKISDPRLSDQLERLFIFEFANEYYANQEVKPNEYFEADDEVLEEYGRFLLKRNYIYISPVEKQIHDLRMQLQNETGQEDLIALLKQAEEKERMLSNKPNPAFNQELKEFLRFEILSHRYYREGAAKLCLKDDPAIQKAISVITDRSTYQSLLRPSK
ncbi:MAG: S41 family peptidase [Bacteroidales bacterium]|nr:S41 family peptidase [Bacteroidales bacterium]